MCHNGLWTRCTVPGDREDARQQFGKGHAMVDTVHFDRQRACVHVDMVMRVSFFFHCRMPSSMTRRWRPLRREFCRKRSKVARRSAYRRSLGSMVTEASKAVLPIKSCWATTPAVEDGDGHEMGTAGALVHMIKAGRWAVERMTTRAATAGILERPSPIVLTRRRTRRS